LADEHWGYDLGIELLTRELAERLQAPAVLGRFSRLLIDPNRPLDSDTLFRQRADGRPILLNQDMSQGEKNRRIDALWRPYHTALGRVVRATKGAFVMGMHSFTPMYEGKQRAVELGVLFDHDADFGADWFEAVRTRCRLDVRLNEPWSGLGGFMFGPQSHATRHGRRAIEIEVRQDIAVDPEGRREVVELLATVVELLA
jgi:predicted N-formylglutamate amidohydrolase